MGLCTVCVLFYIFPCDLHVAFSITLSKEEGRWMLQCGINSTQTGCKNAARSFVAFIGYTEIEVVRRIVCSINCTLPTKRLIRKNNIICTLTKLTELAKWWHATWMIPNYITTEAQTPPSKEYKKQLKKHISKRFHQFTLHYQKIATCRVPQQLPYKWLVATLQPSMPARNPLVEAPDTCAASTKALTTASDVSSNGTFLAPRD